MDSNGIVSLAAIAAAGYFFYKVLSWGSGQDANRLPERERIFYGNDNLVGYEIFGIPREIQNKGSGLVEMKINNAYFEVDKSWVQNHKYFD